MCCVKDVLSCESHEIMSVCGLRCGVFQATHRESLRVSQRHAGRRKTCLLTPMRMREDPLVNTALLYTYMHMHRHTITLCATIITRIGTVPVAPVWRHSSPFLFTVEGGGCFGFVKEARAAGPTPSNALPSRSCPSCLNIEIKGQGGSAPP